MKQTVLPKNQQFLDSESLHRIGFTNYLINKMVAQNILKRLSKSMYENMQYEGDISDYAYLNVIAPKAVVCLMSAARYYNLTTYLPDTIDIAIENSMKISSLPEWPSFHVMYFSDERFKTGITTASDGYVEFRIYDKEKTVTDILSYRNKVGIEETKEILINFLHQPDRNINQLHRYASLLGVEKILRNYLEVLL